MIWKLAWTLVMLGIAVGFLVLETGGEVAISVGWGSGLAQEVAPKLGVSESRMREELTRELEETQTQRMIRRAVPWSIMIVLLVMRLLFEWRAFRIAQQAGVPPRVPPVRPREG